MSDRTCSRRGVSYHCGPTGFGQGESLIESGLTEGVHRRPAGRTNWPPIPPCPDAAELSGAADIVRRVLGTTPALESLRLGRRWNRKVFLKYENVSPVRSFKTRGAVTAIADLADSENDRGAITASTGNHGQGLAFASHHFGVPVTIVIPENAESAKVTALEDLGATLEVHGRNLTEAQDRAAHLAAATGATFIEDGNHFGLMKGAASIITEMMSQVAGLDTVVVPIGGGNLIAGTLLAAAHTAPDLTIVGVQSSAAPGATESWLTGEVVTRECTTFAGGLATEYPGAVSLEIMDALLDTMILVSDDDLWQAIGTVFDATGAAVEGAAAAGIAAMDRFGDEIPGDTVGLLLTGGWISRADLVRAIGLDPN